MARCVQRAGVMHSSLRSIVYTVAVLTAVLIVTLFPASARADLMLGADVDLAPALVDHDGVELGVGVAGRLGAQFDAPLLTLTPELVGSYHSFGGSADARVYRGLAGLRLGIGEILRPGVYAHLGVARVNASDAASSALERTGFGFDAGAILDLTLIPILDVGLHAAYNRVLGGDTDDFDWITVGAHVELVF